MGQIRRRIDRRSTALWLALALAVTLVPTAPMPAPAQEEPPPLTVCSGCDHTTIQSAIDAAVDGDVIEVAEGTYNENLVVRAMQLTIRGINRNPFTIDAGGNGRGLTISNGSVYLLDATVTGGAVDSNDVLDDGGGILVDSGSRLDLQDSLVTGNTAVNGGGIAVRGESFLSVVTSVINSNIGNFGIGGGGVYAEAGSSLEFTDSEISDNQVLGTGNGGGLFTAADFSMLRTTVSGNSLPTSGDLVDADGGGIFFEGVAGNIQTSTIHANAAQHRGGGILVSAGSLTIADSTLTANQAGDAGNLIAVPNDAGQASFVRSILAENQPLGESVSPDCSGSGLSSGGYNFLDGADACSFTLADTDLVNADGANLGLLEDNGGNTRTRLPLSGSPVIDAIPEVDCPTDGVLSADQRLLSRPQGDGCDIGSVEVEVVAALPTVSISDGIVTESDFNLTTECLQDLDGGLADEPGENCVVVTASSASASDIFVTLSFGALGDTATDPEDYVAPSDLQVTIPAGSTKAGASFQVTGDDLAEPDESFTIEIAEVTGATIADGVAIWTIENDDFAPQATDDAATGARLTETFLPVVLNDTDQDTDVSNLSVVAGSEQLVGVEGPILSCSGGFYCTLTAGSPGKSVSFEYDVTDGTNVSDTPGTATVEIRETFSGEGTASINGALDAGEWDAADTFDVLVSDGLSEGLGRVYLMNDATNLYFALEVSGISTGDPLVEIRFDENGDGVFSDREDALRYHDGVCTDAFYDTSGDDVLFGFIDDSFAEGSNDCQAESTTDGNGVFTVEFAHPLSSGDTVDIGLLPGDTVAFQIEARFSLGEKTTGTTTVPGDGGTLDWMMTGSTGTVSVTDISTDSNTLEAGYAVPLAEIPPERLVFGATTIAGAPMAAIELDASPMAAIPMAAIPMAAIGGTSALGQTLLSEIPIEGGWEPLLVGTPYEGRPLQTLTLDEVAPVLDPALLAELTLGSLRLGNTGLADLSISALMLGGVPLNHFCTSPLLDCSISENEDFNTDDSVLDIESSGGVVSAPMGAIPMAAIPMGAIGDLESAPMGAIPMAAIPMGAIPMGAIGDIQANPLGAIPMGAIANLAALPMAAIDVTGIPMGAIPMAAIPLGEIDLGAVPMGAIPMGAIGGGCNGLVDCSFPGVDDFTTVDEYLVATGSSDIASSPMAAIPMGAIPMGAIPMGAIPMAAIPMAAIPMAAITTATPFGYLALGAIPLEGDDTITEVCAVQDAPDGCDEQTLLWEYASSLSDAGHENLASTPMAAIELGDLPMAAIPMAAIELGVAEIAGVPMAAIEFDSIDLVNSPMGAVPMAAIAGCDPTSTLTVLEGAALGEACLDGATLGDVDPAVLDTFELGDVLNHLTLGFLAQIVEIRPEFGELTYGEIVVSILLAIDFPWEELPLDQIETRDVACDFDAVSRTCTQGDGLTPDGLGEPDIVEMTVDFGVSEGPVVGDVVQVTIPADWGYIPGSAALTDDDVVILEDGSLALIADPNDDGDGGLTFSVPVIDPGTYTLRFALAPGFELGSGFQVSADEIGGETPVSLTSPITVVEGLEFGDLADAADTAIELLEDHLYVGYIRETGDEDWWEVAAPEPGNRVAVYLSNLAGDVDTFVYRPATVPLGNDAAERDIPLGIQPFDDDDVFLGGGGSLSPEVLADSPLNQPAGTVLGDASANRGADNEFAEFSSRSGDTEGAGDQYTIQVAGFQDATSDSPYVLRVRYREEVPTPQCAARVVDDPVDDISPPPAIPFNVDTIFLANWDRMAALYPDADVSALSTQLETFANSTFGGVEVNGVVVPIGSIPGVADAFNAWDTNPCDATAANSVVDLLTSYVQGVADSHPTLRHVTIVGSDEMVPFARLEDETIVANESTYTEGFGDTALFGSQFTRHYLSDAPYGDLDPIPWLGRHAYVPDLGVGRLVESPSDIAGALTTFTDNGGVLDPQTAATAGYDFLTDGSQEVKSGLGEFTDLDPNGDLIAETWSRSDLLETAYGDDGKASTAAADVISPNAHYDHFRALPAIGNLNQTESDLFTVGDVDPLTASDLERRIIFTMGCHSGLNVPDVADDQLDNLTDWAQVYGERRAVYIGNTGYGYGDTATVALSEQVMANLASNLGNGQTIGQNLAQAVQDQFGQAGLYGVYDLKAMEEATLYGLPFWRVNVPGASPITGNGSATSPVTKDPVTDLPSASFSTTPTFTSTDTDDGVFYEADGGTQFMHWRPIQPKTAIEATQDGLVATGVVLTDLVSEDVLEDDVVFARPNTTDAAGREPEVEFEGVIFPTTFASIGTYDLLNPDRTGEQSIRQQRVNLLAGQYVGPIGVQRLFNQMDGTVYYADDADLGSVDWTPPVIASVEGEVVGDQVVFDVEASDPDSDVSRVVALFRSSIDADGISQWELVELVNTNGTWTGGGTFGNVTPPIDYIVQAVNGDGVVGVSTFKGEFHEADILPPAPSDITCNDSACVTDWYRGLVKVDSTSENLEASVDGDTFQQLPREVSGDAIHTVVIQRPDGSTEQFGLAIDGTPPALLAGIDGAVYEVGEVVEPTEVCVDSLSGVVACGPINTSQTGEFNVNLPAEDGAGNTTDLPFTYYVVDPLVLDASPSLVQLGQSTTLTTNFTLTAYDPIQTVDWGDGNVEVCSTTQPGGCTFSPGEVVESANVSVDHTYAEPGVYRVSVELAHGDRRVQTEVFEFVVVYDPDGGFVTGGGWIDSPGGAYPADPGLTGKATFGFVSKYKKGADVPVGKTEFQFRAADLNFKSTDYEWLVVSGEHRAQFKGTGTIEGQDADYGFMVTVIDEANTSSEDVDLFRIKIWWEDEDGTEHIVYDNELDADDDTNPETAIAGGSIVIHSGKNGPN